MEDDLEFLTLCPSPAPPPPTHTHKFWDCRGMPPCYFVIFHRSVTWLRLHRYKKNLSALEVYSLTGTIYPLSDKLKLLIPLTMCASILQSNVLPLSYIPYVCFHFESKQGDIWCKIQKYIAGLAWPSFFLIETSNLIYHPIKNTLHSSRFHFEQWPHKGQSSPAF